MTLKNNRGITIVEIILAMSFTVVIMVILFAALRLGYKAQETGDRRAEETQKVRIIADRMQWLLRGAYPYSTTLKGKQKLYFRGRSDSVGFVTTSTDTRGKGPEDQAGLKWVSVSADREGLKITEKVYFLEDVFEDSGGKPYTLEPDIKKLSFEYFDLPENEKTGEWVSSWDEEEKDYLPAAVKVMITFNQNNREVVLPELIVNLQVLKKTR
ncbi:MAG: hypothetical protein C0402_01120 [Thermodesulfovibrio sp.]|nr:hypothetical protein [Thermodesulfovibrio sp.]